FLVDQFIGLYWCLLVRKNGLASSMLNSNSRAPAIKGAPGKYRGALSEVNQANKLFMVKGPIMEATLIRLVSPPCNSPCSLRCTWVEISPCSAGPAIPPRQ